MESAKTLTSFRRHLKSALIAVVAMVLTAGQSVAIEKYWAAHEATLIVVGTMRPGFTFPWLDGWHVTGTIVVDEVLYGHVSVREIPFRFICNRLCPSWPPPPFNRLVGSKKWLWFLRTTDQKTWESALGSPDGGFRDLSQRSSFENYIRLYKR